MVGMNPAFGWAMDPQHSSAHIGEYILYGAPRVQRFCPPDSQLQAAIRARRGLPGVYPSPDVYEQAGSAHAAIQRDLIITGLLWPGILMLIRSAVFSHLR